MKKLALFLSLLLILHSSTIRSQTIDVNLSGRISGDFTMPTDNFYHPADWGGAYLYLDDFVTSLSDTNLTINLRFKNDKSIDSLNIFFGLNEYSNSLIDSNNFTIVYDTASFLTFLYYFVDLPDPYIDGIQIYSTTNNSVTINSVELRLTNQHFNFGEAEFLLFCLDSNIPRGNVVWMPMQVGNVWEYNEYVQSDSTYADFQYKVIDSTIVNNDNLYLIEKWKLNELVWTKVELDTVKIDSLNNLVNTRNELYFFPDVLWENGNYIQLFSYTQQLKYITSFSDFMPGLAVFGTAVTGVGFLSYYYSGIGFPPEYDMYLKGAKINGAIVYGQLTHVSSDVSNNPNNFSLSQNYPNPFNPSTKISWQAPVSGWQTLKVYDVLGNEVATLVDEYRNVGSYEVEFKSSVGNRQLANGVYFYQLKAGEYVESKKMILLK